LSNQFNKDHTRGCRCCELTDGTKRRESAIPRRRSFFALIKKTEVMVVKGERKEEKKKRNLDWIEDSDSGWQKLG